MSTAGVPKEMEGKEGFVDCYLGERLIREGGQLAKKLWNEFSLARRGVLGDTSRGLAV
jgi:hypothetical protein